MDKPIEPPCNCEACIANLERGCAFDDNPEDCEGVITKEMMKKYRTPPEELIKLLICADKFCDEGNCTLCKNTINQALNTVANTLHSAPCKDKGESNKQSALFKIGKFEFFQSSIEKENYYIMHESGEGGDFPKLEVSAAIEKYYTENF